jgi:hypothetical protein
MNGVSSSKGLRRGRRRRPGGWCTGWQRLQGKTAPGGGCARVGGACTLHSESVHKLVYGYYTFRHHLLAGCPAAQTCTDDHPAQAVLHSPAAARAPPQRTQVHCATDDSVLSCHSSLRPVCATVFKIPATFDGQWTRKFLGCGCGQASASMRSERARNDNAIVLSTARHLRLRSRRGCARWGKRNSTHPDRYQSLELSSFLLSIECVQTK